MNIIKENPYRILGVFANSKASDIQKNKNKIKAFLAADADVELDHDFPHIGPIDRTEESVSSALSKVNLGEDKILYGLFWFFDGTLCKIRTDEPAFDSLQEGDIEEAIKNWKLLTASPEVNSSNFSAHLNLSTLLLFKSVNGSVDINTFTEAVKLKLKVLDSEFLKNFCVHVAGETFKPNKESVQHTFIKELDNSIVKSKKLKLSEFLKIINSLYFSAKSTVLKHFVQSPVADIEKKIEYTKSLRKAKPSESTDFGRKLLNETKESLALLKSILGSQDIKYTSTVDKVADEVLQCGIDYFNKFHDSDTVDPGEASLICCKMAKSIALGSIINQRCDDNIKNIQEWITDKPEREKQKKVKDDLLALVAIIEKYENANETISNAKSLVNSAKPHLSKIKSVLGGNDKFYMNISTRVAAQAQSYVIAEVNEAQENIEIYMNLDRAGTISRLKTAFSNGWAATVLISSLDMESDYKNNRFIPNKNTLKSLCTQLGISTYESQSSYSNTQSRSSSTSSSSNSHRSSSSSGGFNFAANAWWIFALGGGLIGLAGGGGGFVIGLIIGFIIGRIITASAS